METGESESKQTFDERQIVVFKLGNEEFGVNIMEVREIIRMEDITKIPNSEQFVEGVINLRGGIIVVINLAMKLGLPNKESDKNTRIIVIEMKGSTVGMVVDSATEVLRLNGSDIKAAPEIITKKIDSSYIEGVGVVEERLLILLDLAKVLGGEDYDAIAQASGQDAGSVAEVKEENIEKPSGATEEKPPETSKEEKPSEPEEKPQEK
jgi:purine-binding chemotaxis protein CheW